MSFLAGLGFLGFAILLWISSLIVVPEADHSALLLNIIVSILFALVFISWSYLDDILSELQKANGQAENQENEETRE